MRGILTLVLLSFLLATGCSRVVRRAVPTPAPEAVERVVTPHPVPEHSAWHTERVPSTATAPTPDPDPEPEPVAPMRFEEIETQHVGIVRYDPFGGAERIEIDLDALARDFYYPHPGNVTSGYGQRGRAMHTGVDLQAAVGDTIRAALAGTVRMSAAYAGYGNVVVVRHPCGLETVYAHHTANLVRQGEQVRAGDPIGMAGRTGRATGVHLHFETRVAGEHFDPRLMIDTERRTIRRGTLTLARSGGRVRAIDPSAPAPEFASASASTSTSTPLAQTADAHRVQRGDTLYSISRRYGVSVDRLCQLNGIAREGILSIGQTIKLH